MPDADEAKWLKDKEEDHDQAKRRVIDSEDLSSEFLDVRQQSQRSLNQIRKDGDERGAQQRTKQRTHATDYDHRDILDRQEQIEGFDRYEATVISKEAAGDRCHAGGDDERQQFVTRDADAERFSHRLANMQSLPCAAAAAAQKIHAYQEAHNSRCKQDEIPGPAVCKLHAGKARRIDDNTGRETALGLVFAAKIDDDEMQGQRAHGKVKATQPKRGQAENKAKHDAGQRRSRQREPEWRADFTRKNSGGKRAGSDQAGVAERNLA